MDVREFEFGPFDEVCPLVCVAVGFVDLECRGGQDSIWIGVVEGRVRELIE